MSYSFRDQIRRGTDGTPRQEFDLGEPPAVPADEDLEPQRESDSPSPSSSETSPLWTAVKTLGQVAFWGATAVGGAALIGQAFSRHNQRPRRPERRRGRHHSRPRR